MLEEFLSDPALVGGLLAKTVSCSGTSLCTQYLESVIQRLNNIVFEISSFTSVCEYFTSGN